MKNRYIVFYATPLGNGMTDIKLSRKERPNSIQNIENIQGELSVALSQDVAVTGFQYVGKSWK